RLRPVVVGPGHFGGFQHRTSDAREGLRGDQVSCPRWLCNAINDPDSYGCDGDQDYEKNWKESFDYPLDEFSPRCHVRANYESRAGNCKRVVSDSAFFSVFSVSPW